ncbi:MAG TPA: transcriptional regulator, partial [Armatimonadota bacterium]|nr:transcriptional regulator [Armatimonadota bacterium]
RERELRFEVSGLKLWDAALPFLRSPVQKRVATVFEPSVMPTLKAGLTALSTYSMILASSPSTLAISPEAWKTAKVNVDIYDVDYEDDNAYNLEIWRYDPFVLSSTNAVDRLSLFLSLRDTNDERIEAALDEMMEGVEW